MTDLEVWFQLSRNGGFDYVADGDGTLKAHPADASADRTKTVTIANLRSFPALREVCDSLADIATAHCRRPPASGDSAERVEAIDVFLAFRGLEGGPEEYQCSEETSVVLNPFFTPTVTGVMKDLPNRRVRALVHAYGLSTYDGTKADVIRGKIFHRLAQEWLQGRLAKLDGSTEKQELERYLRSNPWDALTLGDLSPLRAEVRERCQNFVIQPFAKRIRDSRPLVIESSLLSTDYAIRARPDVRDPSVVTDIKSGGAYDDARQQVHLYMAVLGGQQERGQIISWEKRRQRFISNALANDDPDPTLYYEQTRRGRADYVAYRNLAALRLLNDMLVPDRTLVARDVDLRIAQGSKAIAPSCASWDVKSCARLEPLLGSERPCGLSLCEECSGEEPIVVEVPSSSEGAGSEEETRRDLLRYVRQMLSMVERQRYLAHLSFGHLWRRPVEARMADARVIVGLTYEGPAGIAGVYSFRCETGRDDHSDATPGASVVLVAARCLSSDGRDWELVRDPSGNIQYIGATLRRRLRGKIQFKIEGPHAQGELERLGTFIMDEALREDSVDLECRTLSALAQRHLASSWTPETVILPSILLSSYEPPALPEVSPELDGFWGAVDRAFADMPIDRNKKDVVSRALAAQDFFLIQGPPGTGKTLSILLMTLFLLRHTNRRIRIATFTNKAALRILETFSHHRERSEAILGSPGWYEEGHVVWAGRSETLLDEIEATGNDALRAYLLETPPIEEVPLWARKRKAQIRVLVGTVNAVSSNAVAREWQAAETLSVVDEASQLTEPMTLAGIGEVDRFVLVGDERQLSPVLVETDAIPHAEESPMTVSTVFGDEALAARGVRDFSESLFERLCVAYPARRAMLTQNYRSRPQIVEFVADAFYEQRLEAVRPASEACVNPHAVAWNDPANAVVVVDVPRESEEGGAEAARARVSRLHAHVVASICGQLTAAQRKEIAVVTPFNAQVVAIRRALEELPGEWERPQVYTVDKFQGREAEVVVYDISCSPGALRNMQKLKEFTSDDGLPYLVDKKLNVALTRPKDQLVLVYDEATLESDATKGQMFLRYLDFLREKRAEGAKGYAFVDWGELEAETAVKADALVEMAKKENAPRLAERSRRQRQVATLERRQFWPALAEESRGRMVDAMICDDILGPQRDLGLQDLSAFTIMFCKAAEKEIVDQIVKPNLGSILQTAKYSFRVADDGRYTLGSIAPLMKWRLKDLEPQPASRILRALARDSKEGPGVSTLREDLWALIRIRNEAAHVGKVDWNGYERARSIVLGTGAEGSDSVLARISELCSAEAIA